MKAKGEIKSWNPFLAKYKDYTDSNIEMKFNCKKCGSNSCERYGSRNPNDPYFFQGNFKCVKCGKKGYNYYSDSFIKTIKIEVQLNLFD
jgi:hypothetical protein